MNKTTYTHKLGNADLVFEINDWMKFTDMSMVASMGETKVMVAIALGGETDKNYMPLKVEYQERYYARGEILGGKYNKREGKPSTEAVLTARLIDRAIRPYFPTGFTQDIQVVITVLSLGDYDPDMVALNATTLALKLSSLPWEGNVGGVRVIQDKEGKQIISPTYTELETNNLFDAVVCTHNTRVCMLEVEAHEVQESVLEQAIEDATKEIKTLIVFFEDIITKHGKEKISHAIVENNLQDIFNTGVRDLVLINFAGVQDKIITEKWKQAFINDVKSIDEDISSTQISEAFEIGIRSVVRKQLSAGLRMDGRGMNMVRELYAQAGGVSDKLHGSGLFYRGETHVLSVLTLGQLADALFIDGMEINTDKNFIHHYNFPSYSVGETGRMGSPGRREIGHGQLAEKAFRRVLPDRDTFPYTMRVVSEVLSSNGSTSMGSVCGTSLALHNAGVPMKNHVAGLAIGLVYNSDDDYNLVTDILGKEDHWGDMDFKVAGTRAGITAIQLDCKFEGLTSNMIIETFIEAKKGRTTILEILEAEIKKPNTLIDHVEQVEKMTIPESMIGMVIGRGGVTIKKITKDSGAKIDIKRDGTAFILGQKDTIAKAKKMIQSVLDHAKENPKI